MSNANFGDEDTQPGLIAVDTKGLAQSVLAPEAQFDLVATLIARIEEVSRKQDRVLDAVKSITDKLFATSEDVTHLPCRQDGLGCPYRPITPREPPPAPPQTQ